VEYEIIKGVATLKMNFLTTTTVAALLWLFGNWARRVMPALERYCIPAPVIGGFVFAMMAWFLRSANILVFQLDNLLQTPFQLIFFTSIGLAASLSLLMRGGKLFVLYLVVACWLIAIIQNGIGVVVANLVGVHPVLG
jgi:ESS family glutamate:Na+ symporter